MAALKFESPNLSKAAGPPEASLEYARNLRAVFDQWRASRESRFAFAGASEQITLSLARIFFEAQGQLVNIDSAPEEDYTGFFLETDGGVPAAFINRKVYSKKAQLFTLLHEYAHSVVGVAGISDPFVSENSLERDCNRFAVEFIAPLDEFTALVERLPKDEYGSTDSLIKAVSRRTWLSLVATGIRLVESGYLKQDALNAWQRQQYVGPRPEKDEEPSASGGAVHAKRVGEVGYLASYLAKLASDARIIDFNDVRDGLNIAESLQEKALDLAARRMEIAVA